MKYVPTLFDVLDNAFNDAFANDSWFTRRNNLMKTDIHQKDGKYLIEVDLPGYSKDDIHLDLKNGYLTIAAHHDTNDQTKDEKGNVIRTERSFGSATRSLYVGEDVKTTDVTAKFENGVLTLTLPDTSNQQIETKSDPIAIE